MSSMQKNHQHLVRPCAVFLERLNEIFIPSKRCKVDADIIYRSSNEQNSIAHHHNEELSVDVLMLPNNKVKISSSSTFDDILPTSSNQININDDIKPVVRIRPHQSSIDSNDFESSTVAAPTKQRSNSLRRIESSSSNKYDSDSYLFNGTFDSDDELGMDLNDDDLASINHVLDFDDDDDMSNFDDENAHLSSTTNSNHGPGYHPIQLPDLVMGSIRSENGVKSEPSFQYSDLFNRKGRTFVCDERGNRVVSVKLEKNSAKRLIDAIERNSGRLVLEECRRGDLQAHILKVVFKDEQEFFDFNRSGIVSKHSFKQCPEMYTRFLESLFESQTYPNENETDPLGPDDTDQLSHTYSCKVHECGEAFTSKSEAIKHAKKHAELDPFDFVCDHCGKKFLGIANMKRHLRVHMGSEGKDFACPLCHYRGCTTTHVKRHMAHKHLEKSIPCPYCSFMAATNADLKIHMARRHWDIEGLDILNNLPKTYKKEWKCNKCDTVFHDYSDFQNHIYSHSSQTNKFQCNLCPYNCKSFSKLKRHMLYHQGQRNYECPKCNNKFYQMEHLKRHLTSIHKLNIPQIGRGNRLFSSDILKRHSDMPNIPPPHGTVPQCYKVISKCVFTCQKCPFSTTKLYHLNEHVKSEHLQLDDSAHVCTFCSYITDKKTNLKRHLHHNHAGQSNTPVLLSNDALLSNPNTKFQCGLCRRYQSNVDEFIKHITEKHRMDVVILDSANNGNIHQQIKSRGRAELICASNNSTPFRFDEFGGLVTVYLINGSTILRDKSMHTSTYFYIINVNIADILLVLSCLPERLAAVFGSNNGFQLGMFTCYLLPFLQQVSMHAAFAFLLVLTIHRCYPAGVPRFLQGNIIRRQIRNYCQTLCIIWAFAIIINLPLFAITKYEIHRFNVSITLESQTNMTSIIDAPYCFTEAEETWSRTYLILLLVFTYIITGIFLIVIYGQVIRIILTSKKYSQKSLNHHDHHHHRFLSQKNVQDKAYSSKFLFRTNQRYPLNLLHTSTTPLVLSKSTGHQDSNSSSTNSHSTQHLQVIIMLFIVILLYILLLLPYRLLNLLYIIHNHMFQHTFINEIMFQWLINIVRLLVFLNCALQPITYLIISSRLRQTVWKLFRSYYTCHCQWSAEISTPRLEKHYKSHVRPIRTYSSQKYPHRNPFDYQLKQNFNRDMRPVQTSLNNIHLLTSPSSQGNQLTISRSPSPAVLSNLTLSQSLSQSPIYLTQQTQKTRYVVSFTNELRK
ncbi:hypothetical protein I4U23_018712 [Adineta vaga]|nr:hypothetical protein I4U23_018712 [Adineta vaga]